MDANEILFGKQEEDYDYSSGSVRARASSAERNIPALQEEAEQLETRLREVRTRIAMWERYATQAMHLETLRTVCNGGKDFTDEEGQHFLFGA